MQTAVQVSHNNELPWIKYFSFYMQLNRMQDFMLYKASDH